MYGQEEKQQKQIEVKICNNLKLDSAMGIQMENGTSKQVTAKEQMKKQQYAQMESMEGFQEYDSTVSKSMQKRTNKEDAILKYNGVAWYNCKVSVFH